MKGPRLFYDLGEMIGILSHITSFWNYRVVMNGPKEGLHYADYADILMDFEESLAVVSDGR